jgi:SAM-dependent methyltransferase
VVATSVYIWRPQGIALTRLSGLKYVDGMMMGELRASIWQKVQGEKILEVGVGTGKNFPHYPAKAITAIDFSPAMINEASKKRKNLGVVVDLSIMDVQQLDFPDNHFDSVIGTFLFFLTVSRFIFAPTSRTVIGLSRCITAAANLLLLSTCSSNKTSLPGLQTLFCTTTGFP